MIKWFVILASVSASLPPMEESEVSVVPQGTEFDEILDKAMKTVTSIDNQLWENLSQSVRQFHAARSRRNLAFACDYLEYGGRLVGIETYPSRISEETIRKYEEFDRALRAMCAARDQRHAFRGSNIDKSLRQAKDEGNYEMLTQISYELKEWEERLANSKN